MHKRDQRNSNTFMDIKDRSDHKLKVHRSQQTHRKRVTSYGSPRDHCIENQERERERERGSHLCTNYGPVGLQRTTHAS